MSAVSSIARRKVGVVAAWMGIALALAGAIGSAQWLATRIRASDVGIGICVPLGGLLLLGACTLGPTLWAGLTALFRCTARTFGATVPYVAYRPVREIMAPEPWLQGLMQDTRSILQEMDHVAMRAQWWPSDAPARGCLARLRWRGSLATSRSLADFAAVNRVTRDVWEWVRAVEALSPARRDYLQERGLDVDRLRGTLLADADFHTRFRAIVRLLRTYEERLFAFPTDPFRGMGASQSTGADASHKVPARPATGPSGERTDDSSLHQVYAALVEKRGPVLRVMASEFARTPVDADDLYQDMLMAIWKALPRFRGESSLATYAQRIARSTAIDYARRYRLVVDQTEFEDPAADPEQQLACAMEGARLRDAIDDLPHRLREALVLYLDGHDYRTIATRTGTSEGNVGARLTRARARIRRRLAPA